jgi:hypothetical protein
MPLENRSGGSSEELSPLELESTHNHSFLIAKAAVLQRNVGKPDSESVIFEKHPITE